MRDIHSIWFYNYDAKASLLYRSAMTLREEKWHHKATMQEAKWWVIYEPDEQTEQDIMTMYRAEEERPIIVILKDDGRSEYHKSWAVLRMPLNYVTFFKWIDDILNKIVHGSLDDNINILGQQKDADADVINDVAFTEEQWFKRPFRLKRWPNVARFGDDMKIVLYCSKMLRGYCTYEQLIKMGMNPQQLSRLLVMCDKHGMIYYEPKEKTIEMPVLDAEMLLNKKIDPKSITLAEIDAVNPLEGETNERSMNMFNAILKVKNLFKSNNAKV